MHNPFTKHPRDNANETWWKHCKFAWCIGLRLYFTSWIFIIHGIFPFLCETTASDGIKELNDCMQERRKK